MTEKATIDWRTDPLPRGAEAEADALYLVEDRHVGLAVGGYLDPEGERSMLAVHNGVTGYCVYPQGDPVVLRDIVRWARVA